MIIPTEKLERATKLFRIPNRFGQVVPFRLNDAQQRYIRERSKFDVILKARQFGFSSFLELEGTILCARYPEQRAVVIAHDRESTQRLLNRTRFFLEDVARLGVAIPYKHYTKNEIVFTETNSTIYVGTAGSRKFGRGDTINFLHCSEVSIWPSPKETMAGLIPAAKYGRIVLESTASGKGNYFHRQCVKALMNATDETDDGFNKYITKPVLHFYPWHEFAEYTIPGVKNVRLTNYDHELYGNEEALLRKYPFLTFGQLAWRRQALEEMPDPALFPQEYPMTFDEAFLETGHGKFGAINFVYKVPIYKERGLAIYEERKPDGVYSMGIDTGGGTRQDFSVAEVVNMRTMEQVAEYAVNDVPPKRFGKKCLELARRYDAFVTPEIQHGLIVIDVFKENYKANKLYYREKTDRLKWREQQELIGFFSTEIPKRRIVAKGRDALDNGAVIHSSFLKDQLESFVETPDGKLQAEEGCHDDAVIAYCLSMEGMSQMRIPVIADDKPRERHAFEGWTYSQLRDFVLGKNKKVLHL